MSNPLDDTSSAPKSPLGEAPRPAFKVTRSPFAPKIAGVSQVSSASGPTPPVPSMTRKVAARSSGNVGVDDVTPASLALDAICAIVAVGSAAMMAIAYFK